MFRPQQPKNNAAGLKSEITDLLPGKTQTREPETSFKELTKMKKAKQAKNKPYRSGFSNAMWSFREIGKNSPLFFLLMVLDVPLNVALAYANIYLPALVVGDVTRRAPLDQAALRAGFLILGMLICRILQNFFYRFSDTYMSEYREEKGLEVNRKSLNLFYQDYERKDIRDLSRRAARATEMWDGVQPISDVPRRSLKLAENILCYLLFGSMIFLVSPLLVPILTIAPAVNWFCARAYRNWEYAHREHWTDIDQKMWYLLDKTSDFAAAKDIRIYGMAGWFRQLFRDFSGQRLTWEKKMVRKRFLSRLADLLVILLRDGAAYLLLIRMTLEGSITVDRFLLYFSAISMFASFIGNIMNEWNGIRATSLDLCDYRRYLDLPEQDGSGEAEVDPLLDSAPEITFDHVSFRYEGAEEDTLQDISFTVKPGEKIALVGLNGAGKTTLVKLLCGLYLPTRGDVRINGISFRSFHRKEYYRLFSAVFQDVQTGFFTLAETVSGQIRGNTDIKRAEQCIRLAGLGKKLDSLPLGIHTPLDKQLYDNATELSGGELQKLMLARALYKNAPILVLDEPTAALDPIAENQIYLQYQDMTRNKTSLFISHRLASTQFCDRILYLKDGHVAQEGTHQELMASGGGYAELYELQSCWYQT